MRDSRQKNLRNSEEEYDPIHVEELNYSSKWMTGIAGATNEFVYNDDGLTWAQVDIVVGTSDFISSGTHDTRLKRRKITEKRRKGKQPMVEEEDEWQDNEDSEQDDEDVTFGTKMFDSTSDGSE
jgi:hypothetical protein